MQRISAHTHNRIVPHATCAFICLTAALAHAQAPDPLLPNTFGTCTNLTNTVCRTTLNTCPSGQVCDPCNQNRYLSFEIPAAGAGTSTAVRIRLDSLHNPSPPPPSGTVPDYTIIQGQDRYLNTVAGSLSRCCDPNYSGICDNRSCGDCAPPFTSCYQGKCCLPPNGASASCNTSVSCDTDVDCTGLGVNTRCEKNLCPDSGAYGTYFRCGLVGCAPEYRDWSDFAGLVTYATGSTVIPSSMYGLSQLAASCAGNEAACLDASPELMVGTERWGNVDCSNSNFGIPSAPDISRLVDKRKDLAGAFIKPRMHLRLATLDPLSGVNAGDIGRVVDAVKGQQYPFHIRCTTACNSNFQCQPGVCIGAPNVGRCSPPRPCATDADCSGLIGAHTCSSNGVCTNAKDACTGECAP